MIESQSEGLTGSICATVLGLGLGAGVEGGGGGKGGGGTESSHREAVRAIISLLPYFHFFDGAPNVAQESVRLSVFVSISHHPDRGDASTAVSDSV